MKEMTPADRLFIEIFIVTPQSEKLWQKVAEYFTRLVQAADDSMFIGWPNPQVAKPHPYVQMRKDCSVIHLEALSSFYTKENLPPDTVHSLLELGWHAPEPQDEDARNFTIEFYGDEPDYKVIGELIMKTFRFGFACTLAEKMEVGPTELDNQVPFNLVQHEIPAELPKEDEMRVRRIGKKIFPSLVNKDPLPAQKFATLAERNQYVLAKRQEGYTLQAIADSLELTREMIRLIVNAKEGPSADEVREIRKVKKSAELRSLVKEMDAPTVGEIAEEMDISTTKVKQFLGKQVKKLPRDYRNYKQYFTDEELIATLQKYAKLVDGPLSAKKFIDLGGTPTIAIFYTRFGSWIKACEAAGVEAGKPAREKYTRAHTEETMLAYVESYLADPRTNGSADGYEKWQRGVDGAPSLALIRQRMGRWNDIKARILKEGKK
jgi:predicted transcriptional regulator